MASRPVGAVSAATFAAPMTYRGPLPLRVAVYGEIASAIRSGVLRTGQLLPPEAETGAAFQVSRTVMREALILLEEDGLIRTQRGVGRFIVDELPEVGLEQLRPVEHMLSLPPGDIETSRVRAEREAVTDFTRRGLGLGPDGVSLMWETVVRHDSHPVALSQEWVAATGGHEGVPGTLTADLEREVQSDASMLAVLLGIFHRDLGPALCHLSVSNAGPDRAHMLDVGGSSPVLLVTQSVSRHGGPLYVAKHILSPEAGHLSLVQSTS